MPISGNVGIIPNLEGFVVYTGSFVMQSGQKLRRDDICHDQRMMISTGAFRSPPR